MPLDMDIEEAYEKVLSEMEFYKNNFQRLVKVNNGQLIIDWRGIAILKHGGEILLSLAELGILSTHSKGNFDVAGCGVSLLGGGFYFTSREAAESYKEKKCSNAQYPVYVYECYK